MDVVVVTGVGGMGVACGRRLGGSAHLVFADFDGAKLDAVVETFTADGFTVTGKQVDVVLDPRRSTRWSRPCATSDRCGPSSTPLDCHPRRRRASGCSRSTCSAPTTC